MAIKKSNRKVLFLDSGIGGLVQMHQAYQKYSHLEYIYFADYLSLPYGNKSPVILRQNLYNIIKTLHAKFNFGTVVLACNTATSVAIGYLREYLPSINFIGTEPAVNLAYHMGYRQILVLATHNTIRYNKTLWRFSLNPEIKLWLQAMPRLAQNVEVNIDDLSVAFTQIRPIISKYLNKIDCVVLGCTHYTLLKNLIEKFMSVPVLDGNLGVINRMANYVTEDKKAKIIFLTNEEKKLNRIQKLWDMLEDWR